MKTQAQLDAIWKHLRPAQRDWILRLDDDSVAGSCGAGPISACNALVNKKLAWGRDDPGAATGKYFRLTPLGRAVATWGKASAQTLGHESEPT